MNRQLPSYHHTAAQVVVDRETRTVRPVSSDGDDYFGLSLGTNGTAAIHRRAIVEATEGTLTWIRANGHAATGVAYVASGNEPEVRNIWSGQ